MPEQIKSIYDITQEQKFYHIKGSLLKHWAIYLLY